MTHIRQSRPQSGLGFQMKVLKTFQVVPSSLAGSCSICARKRPNPKPITTKLNNQAIAVMASEAAKRRAQYTLTNNPAHRPLPSLVVCPTTLVQHWEYEINKFRPHPEP